MGISFVTPAVPKERMKRHKASSGNTTPLPVTISLDQPGRLRAGHLLTLLSITSPTLYRRINTGAIPKPDGRMGRSPYWNTQTVRDYLSGGVLK